MNRNKRVGRSGMKPPDENRDVSKAAAWILLVGLVVLLAAITYWRWTSNQAAPLDAAMQADHASPAPETPPAPVPRSNRYQDTLLHAQYIGSKRCAQCHTDEEASYHQTPHA